MLQDNTGHRDVIIARVEVDESHSVVLTMKGVGLGNWRGCVESIGVQLLDKFRTNNEHVRNVASISDTRIVVGENGRIWIDGEPEGIQSVRDYSNSQNNVAIMIYDSISRKDNKTSDQ